MRRLLRCLSAMVLGLVSAPSAVADLLLATPEAQPGINNSAAGDPVLLYRLSDQGAVKSVTSITPTAQNGLFAPTGIDFSASSELFVSNRQDNQSSNPGTGSISRFLIDSSGNATPNGVIAGNGLWAVQDVAFSRSGELFATNFFNGTISRFTFDRAGHAVANGTITFPGAGNPATLEGLAFSPSGELFVSSYTSIARFRFDSQGNAIYEGSISDPGTGRLHGLAFDSSGRLLVASVDNSAIYEYTFSSSGGAILDKTFTATGPTGLALSPSGELYVTTHSVPSFTSGGIAKFLLDGSGNATPDGSIASPNSEPLGYLGIESLASVPEPSTFGLAAIGITVLALVGWGRTRERRSGPGSAC
jgi:WD40 repeat protein